MRAKTEQHSRMEKWFHTTEHGKIFNGDSYHFASGLREGSTDLIVTSPPFGLVRKKEYGNVPADEYLDWFRPYAAQFYRILKESGSLVIDMGIMYLSAHSACNVLIPQALIEDASSSSSGGL